MRIGGGTGIKINKAALYKEKADKQLKAVSFTSLDNPDKYMVCKTYEWHYEITIIEPRNGKAHMKSFKFADMDEANKKFKELHSAETWKKED